MKIINILSSLSLLLLLALTACDTVEKDELGLKYVAPTTNTDQLIGEWEWARTNSGWVGVETPASKGYTETLTLDKANNFRRSRNGTVAEEKYYYINKEVSSELPQDSVLYIHLIDKKNTNKIFSQPLYLIGADTIMTRYSERCDDCPESYFVKKKAAPIK